MTTLPTRISDLVLVANQPLSSSVSQISQYQQAGLALHTWHQRMGWNVDRSSNGVTSSVGNFITGSGDIVINSASSPHSWAQYSRSGSYIVVDFNNNNTVFDSTPNYFFWGLTTSGYGTGSITNRPAPVVSAQETSYTTAGLFQGAVVYSGTISYQYSVNAGIGWFWTKSNGATDIDTILIIESAADDDSFRDNGPRVILGQGAGTSTITNRGIGTSGAGAGWGTYGCWAWNINAVPGGVFADSRSANAPIYAYYDISTPGLNRAYHISTLIRGAPRSIIPNARDATDVDTWTWWTIGDIWILWEQSAGDIV